MNKGTTYILTYLLTYLAKSVQYTSVTDGQTDIQPYGHQHMAITALFSASRGKTVVVTQR